jgi:hypothetical protein
MMGEFKRTGQKFGILKEIDKAIRVSRETYW